MLVSGYIGFERFSYGKRCRDNGLDPVSGGVWYKNERVIAGHVGKYKQDPAPALDAVDSGKDFAVLERGPSLNGGAGVLVYSATFETCAE